MQVIAQGVPYFYSKIMAFFNTNGMGNDLLGSAINTGTNFLTAMYNNKQAEKREKAARKENFEYGEKAADAADARARAQYNDLYSIQAQMQQAKEAGLSPSVYASGGLQGKQGIGAQGTGASGVSPTTYGVNPIDVSQIRLNNAQARKLNADAKVQEETGIDKANAEIKKLYADTISAQASTTFIQSQTEWQNLMNEFKNESWAYDMQTIQGNAQKVVDECTKLQVEIDQAENDLQLSYQTFWTKVAQEEANLESITKQILNAEKDLQLKEEQINNIVADTKNVYYQMNLAYSRYWQDEKKLNAEIENIKKQYALDVKKYNLELHRERHQTTQGYLNTVFNGIGTILHGATMSNGQTSYTTSSTYKRGGVTTTVTETKRQ